MFNHESNLVYRPIRSFPSSIDHSSKINPMMSRALLGIRRQLPKSITIMTDGACLNNGQDGAVGGIGVHFPNGELKDKFGPLPGQRQTNQRAEIIAARIGIDLAKEAGYHDITVKLDSDYVRKAMDVWIHDWIRHNWSGKITNKEEFLDLYNSMSGVNVYFEWIPREQNKVADQLAKEAAREAQADSDR